MQQDLRLRLTQTKDPDPFDRLDERGLQTFYSGADDLWSDPGDLRDRRDVLTGKSTNECAQVLRVEAKCKHSRSDLLAQLGRQFT